MRTALAVFLAAALCSCATFFPQAAPVERTVAQALISDQEETQLGLQVHEQLTKESTKFLTNAKVSTYVDGIARRIVGGPDRDRANVPWKLFVIDDPKTANAFATPGGRIYVYTGLLLTARNEAEIAGVLGHEMGHVVARHTARQLVATKGIELAVGMALGREPNQIAALTAALAGKGTMLAYGREMEREADTYGVKYASAANYNPDALAQFFELLQSKGDTPELLAFLSTHPTSAERVKNIRATITQTGAKGTDLGADRLAAIRSEIAR
ncbi:MAG: M48 family metalloprotease [Archangiaceae bacterium]|nr:M48 family metalloprotease [Archangiaceae bacterium]